MVNEKLDSKDKFFADVMRLDVKMIQIRNTSKKFYVLSKNLKIEYVKDYTEQDCYMISSKDEHQTIVIKKNNLFRKIHEEINMTNRKTKMKNDIMIYNNDTTIIKIKRIIDEYSDV